ncbi:uncharacterized protein CTHT_0073010 [Thermochaetoides thermophila DSM 1495]|uniref:Uncharacterized protein n=1 Tax=Chaetomium thermophilum (strain DSM 1495 / CBS 144.50 / IMI 039719) TaxID=759272 RepID=G0SHQ6_CHATD|nr:hypothetical protein CTHT_0073010 [Thermochaetoides thermophila DSM 1495]EGS16976.1 hypothetical protein CTHT_0073010 [Thermochaetoides thermophila DSM 1495]
MPIDSTTMAASLEKLEKQLDRLEKLFSKRKKSKPSHDLGRAVPEAASSTWFQQEDDDDLVHFPQPPFIRPTSSRMVARDELLMAPRLTRRARSLPESPSTPRLTTPTKPGSSSTRLADSPQSTRPDPKTPKKGLLPKLRPDIPRRSSSLFLAAATFDIPPELFELNFSSPTGRTEYSLSSGRSPAKSASPVSVSPKSQVERKRRSSHNTLEQPKAHEALQEMLKNEKETLGDAVQSQRESQIIVPADGSDEAAPLSPRLVPLPMPGPEEIEFFGLEQTQTSTIQNQHSTKGTDPTTPSKPDSNPAQSLHEPTLGEFLALKDEDIADSQPVATTHTKPLMPPPLRISSNPQSPVVSTPSSPVCEFELLTLCPPLASRPAAAAALEAARIATKYEFDLVYVVNLWPTNITRSGRRNNSNSSNSPTSSPLSGPSSGDDTTNPTNTTPQNTASSMTGRLLAAYGLPSIMCPFRISAPVHQKVLRTKGWLEYRSEGASLDEFARGYSCSFYTGYTPTTNPPTTTTKSEVRGGQQQQGGKKERRIPNRGVVFAAFRLPYEDGTVRCSDARELDELHRDAERLVDMVLDGQLTKRQVAMKKSRQAAMQQGQNQSQEQGGKGVMNSKQKRSSPGGPSKPITPTKSMTSLKGNLNPYSVSTTHFPFPLPPHTTTAPATTMQYGYHHPAAQLSAPALALPSSSSSISGSTNTSSMYSAISTSTSSTTPLTAQTSATSPSPSSIRCVAGGNVGRGGVRSEQAAVLAI